jgi:guanosine-3',5'-bis(diphosphate) 3'-pyrophosphohydrolase
MHSPHLSTEAKCIKLGDKICNVSDLVRNPPEGWDISRRKAYLDWSNQVVNGTRGTNLELEALFDEMLKLGYEHVERLNSKEE